MMWKTLSKWLMNIMYIYQKLDRVMPKENVHKTWADTLSIRWLQFVTNSVAKDTERWRSNEIIFALLSNVRVDVVGRITVKSVTRGW